jgi:hypothetical protein
MLEDFQDYHAGEKPETRDWTECGAFVIAVPIAYIAAIVIAVAVAIAVPDDVAPPAAVAVHSASH